MTRSSDNRPDSNPDDRLIFINLPPRLFVQKLYDFFVLWTLILLTINSLWLIRVSHQSIVRQERRLLIQPPK